MSDFITQVETVLDEFPWKKTTSRTNARRPEDPRVHSMLMGEYRDPFTRKMKRAVHTNRCPHDWEVLCQYMHQFDPKFEFTTITMNKDFQTRPHVDKNNVGLSYIVGFGDYSGGEFVVEGEKYDIFHQPVLFDGHRTHWTEPFEGTRYSLVYYTMKA